MSPKGIESRLEVVYVRGSQISFIVLPDIFKKAPFFNRIKMWRKFRGHAIYGAGSAAPAQSTSVIVPRPMFKANYNPRGTPYVPPMNSTMYPTNTSATNFVSFVQPQAPLPQYPPQNVPGPTPPPGKN
jgi:hypothetical protein